jgi:hypothetical protein
MPEHRTALFEQPLAEFEVILPPADQSGRGAVRAPSTTTAWKHPLPLRFNP